MSWSGPEPFDGKALGRELARLVGEPYLAERWTRIVAESYSRGLVEDLVEAVFVGRAPDDKRTELLRRRQSTGTP